MSFKALQWACAIRDPDVSASARHVLLTLAQFSDECETCYPSHASLSEITNLSTDTIQRRIKDLVDGGFVYVVNRKNNDGRRLTNYYVLLCSESARAHAVAHGMPPAAAAEVHAADCGMAHAAGETEPCRRENVSMPQLCGNEHPKNTQLTPIPSRGEEGGASRKLVEDDEARLDRWEAFRRIWPWDAAELVGEARAIFLRLSPVEQQSAIDAAPKYVAACLDRETKARNHGIAHAKRWLAGEGWLAVKARPPESAASLAGRPFTIRQGSPQAAAWARYETAMYGAPRLKFFQSKSLGLICTRPTEWPPEIEAGRGDAPAGQADALAAGAEAQRNGPRGQAV